MNNNMCNIIEDLKFLRLENKLFKLMVLYANKLHYYESWANYNPTVLDRIGGV